MAMGLRVPSSKLSVAFLTIHAAIVVINLIYTLICLLILPRGWAGSAWDDIAELVALALNSTPSRSLDGTCAGIENWETWIDKVRIREVNEGHLELVSGLEEDTSDGDGRVVVEKKYRGTVDCAD